MTMTSERDYEDCIRTVEDVDVTGRTIEGIAARFGTDYRVSDDGWATSYEERWRSGAALKSIRERKVFELRAEHSDHERIGSVEFWERQDGLHFQAVIEPDLTDVLRDMEDGHLPSVSVRFNPIKANWLRGAKGKAGSLMEIVEARIRELSLTNKPAYDGVGVESLRTAEVDPEVLERRNERIAAALAQRERFESLRQ